MDVIYIVLFISNTHQYIVIKFMKTIEFFLINCQKKKEKKLIKGLVHTELPASN